MNAAYWLRVGLLASLGCASAPAEERRESFDKDPGWDGHNNRSLKPEIIRQDFGWSGATSQAGGNVGEIGGWINPAAEPAYYAKSFATRTLDDVLTASGTLMVEKGAGHTLVGFFDARTLNEWRTPNTIALRIHQRGEVFHCHLEYCTRKWRASAGIIGRYDKVRDRMDAKELPSGKVYAWSIAYDPNGADGRGLVTATLRRLYLRAGAGRRVARVHPGRTASRQGAIAARANWPGRLANHDPGIGWEIP